MSISDHKCSYAPQAASYVRTVRDDREELDFTPVLIGNNLIDQNPYHIRRELLESTVYGAVESLPAFINERPHTFAEHRRWKLIYQLEIVFPDQRRKWFLDFGADTVQICEGRNPLANYFVFITASSIAGFLEGGTDWDYIMLGGYYRRSVRFMP